MDGYNAKHIDKADSVDYENSETPMADYQFQCYKEERDKREALEKELALLKGNNAVQSEQDIIDYQFKAFMAMIYKIIETSFELGKTNDEILAAIASLANDPSAVNDSK